MADFARGLASIPFDAPRPRSAADLWSDAKTGLDFVVHNLPPAHRFFVRVNPYPRPWRHVEVAGCDGAPLAAWYGQGKPGAPAVLMVPGTFQTKDDTPRKRRALQLWRNFGATVLILDLRGFGGSHAHLGTSGYLEARDVLAAADWLRLESGAPRVHVWGESLGGSVSLLAATLPGADERIERVVAWSPFAELADASRIGSLGDARGQTLVGRTYRFLLRYRTRNEVRDFSQYLERCALELDMEVEALLHQASPLRHVRALRVPATVFHAEDDEVVPVDHARLLAEAASAGASRLGVHVLPRGGHLDFDRAAPRWYADVTRRLFAPAQAP